MRNWRKVAGSFTASGDGPLRRRGRRLAGESASAVAAAIAAVTFFDGRAGG